ncbi:phosphate-binding protein [Halobacteriales archaeon QS_1_67_19]|nr:MAG: phosphate-binding protein [Halobacteriales archaeon QS_1_67_19]
MSDRDTNLRSTRRRFLTATGVTGTALLTGYAGTAQDDSTTEVTWVMNPAQEEIDITVQYQPLFEYLESEADVAINGLPTASYSGTVQELRRAREGDRIFADTSPGAVAQIPDEIDVTGMRVAFGSDRYFSLITTTPDSGIEELADLEGETIASGAPTSVSGTLFPLLMLKNAGLDIGSAPGGSPEDFELRTSDHSTAREQLVSDERIAAAATGAFSTAPHVPKEQFEEMSEDFVEMSSEYEGAGEREPQLDLLAVSDPIPRAPIVSNAAWDEPLKEELRQLMIDAPQEAFEHDSQAELAEQLGVDPSLLEKDEEELTDEELEDVQLVEDHELWFSGIEPATVEDYDPIAELGQQLGLNWEDL